MVVMYMGGRFAGMVVEEGALFRILAVVGDGMHQDRESGPLPCRYRNGGNSEHLRKTVEIDLDRKSVV